MYSGLQIFCINELKVSLFALNGIFISCIHSDEISITKPSFILWVFELQHKLNPQPYRVAAVKVTALTEKDDILTIGLEIYE